MDNSITVKVVFRYSSKSKKSGTLYIRTTSNRKSKFKSLGIQLKKSHWDAEAQRVLPSLKKDFKLFNGIIEDSLEAVEGICSGGKGSENAACHSNGGYDINRTIDIIALGIPDSLVVYAVCSGFQHKGVPRR